MVASVGSTEPGTQANLLGCSSAERFAAELWRGLKTCLKIVVSRHYRAQISIAFPAATMRAENKRGLSLMATFSRGIIGLLGRVATRLAVKLTCIISVFSFAGVSFDVTATQLSLQSVTPASNVNVGRSGIARFALVVTDASTGMPVEGAQICADDMLIAQSVCYAGAATDSSGRIIYTSTAPPSALGTFPISLFAAKPTYSSSLPVTRTVTVSDLEYGLTVIVHGFIPPLPGINIGWTESMGRAILGRAGCGILWKFHAGIDIDSGDWLEKIALGSIPGYSASACNAGAGGEQVIIVDWQSESSNASPGYAEATANSVAALLLGGIALGRTGVGAAAQSSMPFIDISAPSNLRKKIHFIAHSFGTVVASETIRRLNDFNVNVERFTLLDPHDFAEGLVIDTAAKLPDVVIWQNVQNADSYYQKFDRPTGRHIEAPLGVLTNYELSATGIFSNLLDCFDPDARCHSLTHTYYHGTIVPDAINDGDSVGIIDGQVRTWYAPFGRRLQHGFAYSRLGGRQLAIVDTGSSGNETVGQTNCQSQPVSLIFKGDFGDSITPFAGCPQNDYLNIPGTGGAGFRKAPFIDSSPDGSGFAALMTLGADFETHLTYLPVTTATLKLRVWIASRSADGIDDTLDISIDNVLLDLIALGALPIGIWADFAIAVPQNFYGKSVTVSLKHNGRGLPGTLFYVDSLDIGRVQTVLFPVQASRSFILGSTFSISPLATTNSGLQITSYSTVTQSVCTVTGSTVVMVAAGICTLRATQSGNATYASAFADQSVILIAPTSYNLSVQSPSNGTVSNALGSISCGGSCTEALPAGIPVALTAIANNGYTFGGWSGYAGCSSANPCLFNMPASSVNLVANFVSSSILGTFSATGSMSTPRLGHTATLLSNGKVLIAGGDNSSNTAPRLNTAELYDPVSGTFSPTGNLTTGRGGHTATKLADGRVLLVGGVDAWQTGRWLASAEIYDPATGIFTATGSMSIKRSDHVAALLANGKVLIAGGYYSVVAGVLVYLKSAEVFDPVTGVFTLTGSMNTPRMWFSATALSTGKILVAGGSQQNSGTLASTELYDPATGIFTYSANLNSPRLTHFGSATLADNKILFAGGQSFIGTQFLRASELYNPANGTVAAAANMSVARAGATATLLLDGGVIVSGGYTGAVFLRSAEIFNPVSGTFSSTAGDMTTVRYAHTATRLGNGKVLFVGGQISQGTVGSIASSAELYTPALGSPSLLAVQSRKTHASAGAFDLPVDTNMLITDAVTVEPRSIGSGHNIVFQFNQPITASGAVLAVDAASVAIGATAVAAGNEVTVTLAAIPNATRVTISLTGVNGTFNTSASLGFLVGDSNSSRSVNSSDISGVKARSGQATTAANFQFDLNASGSINSSDISAVKARSGSTLP